MIKDPFIVEKILLDHYTHLGKWFRVEDWKFESDTLYVQFTFSSLDEKEFGRMNVTLIYNESEVLRFKNRTALLVNRPIIWPSNVFILSVYGLDIPLTSFASLLKEYSRDIKIEEIYNS